MSEIHHVHLISDSTGDTIHALTRAAVARFGDAQPQIHMSVFVRTLEDLDQATAKIASHRGLVMFTVADPLLCDRLLARCAQYGVRAIAPLDPILASLSELLDQVPEVRPGMQHRITTDYFQRISALDFAIAHDDGAIGARLMQADVILTGVSRSSKTPTCIYLAYRGIKAANMPLVPGVEPDPEFFNAMERGVPVVGLTASPSRLAQVRSQRLEAIGSTKTPDYAEIDSIRNEVAEARMMFDRYEIPVIDVTRRSIEETAAEVLAILRSKGLVGA